MQLHTALVYGAFLNKDYPAVLETAHEVHAAQTQGSCGSSFYRGFGPGRHRTISLGAQHELETLLQEDPKSPSADQLRQILQQIKTEEAARAEAKLHPVHPAETLQTVTFSANAPKDPTAEESMAGAQQVLQNLKQKAQIAEAQIAPDPVCTSCAATSIESSVSSSSQSRPAKTRSDSLPIFRSAVDEVAISFAATDHGRSAMNLTASDIEVQDDNHAPHAILGFRNESGLPLRLGLIIDTSNSVTDRMTFEQAAAIKFLQTVLTSKDDLAFVVGVNNSVLLVQDFSADQALISHGINQLAPGGGTALWDAVSFGAKKLADRPEVQPVARVLIVISDGEDNSSNTTLKEAIASSPAWRSGHLQRQHRNFTDTDEGGRIGDQALKTLSELTGGAEFAPGSVRGPQEQPRRPARSHPRTLPRLLQARFFPTRRPLSPYRNQSRKRRTQTQGLRPPRLLRHVHAPFLRGPIIQHSLIEQQSTTAEVHRRE